MCILSFLWCWTTFLSNLNVISSTFIILVLLLRRFRSSFKLFKLFIICDNREIGSTSPYGWTIRWRMAFAIVLRFFSLFFLILYSFIIFIVNIHLWLIYVCSVLDDFLLLFYNWRILCSVSIGLILWLKQIWAISNVYRSLSFWTLNFWFWLFKFFFFFARLLLLIFKLFLLFFFLTTLFWVFFFV